MPIPIYRITDNRNLPFILEHGLHCAHSETTDPNFIRIGYSSLISTRDSWPVTVHPRGVLGDYIPFFFCFRPVMLFVIKRRNRPGVVGNHDDIVHLVSSVEKVVDLQVPFVFSDRNAKTVLRSFYSDLRALEQFDWEAIHSRNWGSLSDDPERLELKQAEFLVHRHLPLEAITEIGCCTDQVAADVTQMVANSGNNIPVNVRPSWYY